MVFTFLLAISLIVGNLRRRAGERWFVIVQMCIGGAWITYIVLRWIGKRKLQQQGESASYKNLEGVQMIRVEQVPGSEA